MLKVRDRKQKGQRRRSCVRADIYAPWPTTLRDFYKCGSGEVRLPMVMLEILYVGAFLGRLLVLHQFPSVSRLLDNRVEVSTPVTSYKSLLEGIYMLQHQIDPYDGGVFHQSPVLLSLFITISQQCGRYSDFVVNLLYASLDMLIAYKMASIAKLYSSKHPEFYKPSTIVLVYLFNPLVILSDLSKSTIIFSNFCIVCAIVAAIEGRAFRTSGFLALASHLSLYPVYLLPPLVCAIHESKQRNSGSTKVSWLASISQTVVPFVIFTATLFYYGFMFTGSWQYLESTFGVHIFFTKLQPNLGLWWYLFTEMFEFFIPFFHALFQFNVGIYVLPITLRLRHSPVFATVIIIGLSYLFKSYPVIGDLGFFLSFIPLFKYLTPYLRYQIVSVLVLLHAFALAPTFYHLWINLGSGNANFFYAITLVLGLGVGLLISDLIWAELRVEYDFQASGGKGKKEDLHPKAGITQI